MPRKPSIQGVRSLQVRLALRTRELIIRERKKGIPQSYPQFTLPPPVFGSHVTDLENYFLSLPPIPPP